MSWGGGTVFQRTAHYDLSTLRTGAFVLYWPPSKTYEMRSSGTHSVCHNKQTTSSRKQALHQLSQKQVTDCLERLVRASYIPAVLLGVRNRMVPFWANFWVVLSHMKECGNMMTSSTATTLGRQCISTWITRPLKLFYSGQIFRQLSNPAVKLYMKGDQHPSTNSYARTGGRHRADLTTYFSLIKNEGIYSINAELTTGRLLNI